VVVAGNPARVVKNLYEEAGRAGGASPGEGR
jgi:acetyltransferase-like isoleucine patch superfamily enzyme